MVKEGIGRSIEGGVAKRVDWQVADSRKLEAALKAGELDLLDSIDADDHEAITARVLDLVREGVSLSVLSPEDAALAEDVLLEVESHATDDEALREMALVGLEQLEEGHMMISESEDAVVMEEDEDEDEEEDDEDIDGIEFTDEDELGSDDDLPGATEPLVVSPSKKTTVAKGSLDLPESENDVALDTFGDAVVMDPEFEEGDFDGVESDDLDEVEAASVRAEEVAASIVEDDLDLEGERYELLGVEDQTGISYELFTQSQKDLITFTEKKAVLEEEVSDLRGGVIKRFFGLFVPRYELLKKQHELLLVDRDIQRVESILEEVQHHYDISRETVPEEPSTSRLNRVQGSRERAKNLQKTNSQAGKFRG